MPSHVRRRVLGFLIHSAQELVFMRNVGSEYSQVVTSLRNEDSVPMKRARGAGD
ncbi:hypothetical protein QJS04_geneDACA021762 [Acorus gramineus]|uniref:Uncharacterized protein n=1 Tax=Acorus gramineus TaxID=55184 RepID=A0AAV9AGL1_ACOGR|nr:hypothetical protein QJS04_geneDACA021762 [Acorus gramineus]